MYAIPETIDFWVLFYRKDILDSLNISVPDTMEEVRRILPQLHRRGLDFNSHVANFIGFKPFAATMPFIFQHGGDLFGEDPTSTTINTSEALRGITELTENFTIYNMPFEVQSFYQGFRDGRIPLGISNYGMLNLLINAAPEISGLWGIALYPGVENQNGIIERWTSGAAESCIIFRNGNRQQDAWKFLDWWTSTPVQIEFAYTLQSTLGNEYLWNPANIEALKAAPWIQKYSNIIQQVNWIKEPPRVLGGYMVEREISNAINAIVLQGESVRSAVDEAVKRINREVIRRLEEFGYVYDEHLVKPVVVPDIYTIKEWIK